jgi:hypothetical protein
VRLATARTSAVNGYGLVLRYPASWRRYDWQVVTSFTDGMAYLSTGREHNPCRTTRHGDATEIRCRAPIRRLAPGGVLVTWTSIAFPEPQRRQPLAGLPGRLVTLPSGWLEKVARNVPGMCSGIGTTTAVTADFARPTSEGVRYEMDACLRAPDVTANLQQVVAMLRDVQFSPVPTSPAAAALTRFTITPDHARTVSMTAVAPSFTVSCHTGGLSSGHGVGFHQAMTQPLRFPDGVGSQSMWGGSQNGASITATLVRPGVVRFAC